MYDYEGVELSKLESVDDEVEVVSVWTEGVELSKLESVDDEVEVVSVWTEVQRYKYW